MARTKQTARKAEAKSGPPPPPGAPPAPPPPPSASEANALDDSDDSYFNEEEDEVYLSEDEEVYTESLVKSKNMKSKKQRSSSMQKSKNFESETEQSNPFIQSKKKGVFSKGGKSNFVAPPEEPSLSDILNPAVLTKQSKMLKKSNLKDERHLKRDDILDKTTSNGSMNLINTYDFMRTQSEMVDVTVLDFSGVEQITDALFHIFLRKRLTMPKVRRIDVSGCYNLSDAGVKWMTKTFKGIQYFSACGCKKLTEASLVYTLTAWKEQIETLNMSGTSMGVVLPGYSSDNVKLDGCPLISPVKKSFLEGEGADIVNVNPKCYKMVILVDELLPWSPMSIMTQEADVKAKIKLRIKMNCKLDKDNIVNMFEVPINSGFGDVLMSEGCTVVLPYHLAQDGPDNDYADIIVQNMVRIFTKCCDCCFVLMGVTDTPGLEDVASRYENLIFKNFEKHVGNLESNLATNAESRHRGGRYSLQAMIGSGQYMSERFETFRQSKKDSMKPDLFISTILNCSAKKDDLSKHLAEMMIKIIRSLQFNLPWHFLPYQNLLKDAIDKIETVKSPMTSLEAMNKMIRDKTKVLDAFTNKLDTLPYTGKIMGFMHTMGKVLYYPELPQRPVVTEFSFLETIYNALMCGAAPSKATWRYLNTSPTPCWTTKDLETVCPDKHTLSVLLSVLEDNGLLLRLPCDLWTTQIQDRYAYVLYKSLPFYPDYDLENIWPECIPMDETQAERYLYFLPGVPDTFFPSFIRDVLELGGVSVLWKKGVLIQKGPMTILLEMLTNQSGTPVLFIGVRYMTNKAAKTQVTDEGLGMSNDPFTTMLWSTFHIYRFIAIELIIKQKINVEEKTPCTVCLPSKNRYKIVNSRESEVWQISELEVLKNLTTKKDMHCRNDGSFIHKRQLVGPVIHMYKAIPCHYYLGCLPAFSAYNRCLFCQNCAVEGPLCAGNLQNGETSWHCSCAREGTMCDKCGLCQRCVTRLAAMEATVSPSFQSSGSLQFLHPIGSSLTLEQELTPNYSPKLEIHFIRGNFLDLELKLGATRLVYNTGSGTFTRYNLQKEVETVSDDAWKCSGGYNLTVLLKFSQVDQDDMEIVYLVRDTCIYTHKVSTQGCKVTLSATRTKLALVTYMPILKRLREPEKDEFGEKAICTYTTYRPDSQVLSSSIEALMLQGKQYISSALFQAGGVNFSGSSYITLPEQLNGDMLRYPSFLSVKQQTAMHLLCYTRCKISALSVFAGTQGSGTQAVPDSWDVYRMLHLLDNPGFVPSQTRGGREELKQATTLLWAWHFLYRLQPSVILPTTYDNLLPEEMTDPKDRRKTESALQSLVELMSWKLLLWLDLTQIIQTFEDTMVLLQQAQMLQQITTDNVKKTGMEIVSSKYKEDNILYLCSGHHASMKVEEGLTQVMPEIYGKYAAFLVSVDMPSNQLTEIPDKMFNALPNLSEFDCSNNFIEALPSSIGNCKKLFSLTVAENNLTDLPVSLANCTGLHRLDINSNIMELIPAVVTKLTSLKRLYVNNMFMRSLPEDIGNMVNLEKLYANGNCFTSLPQSFTKLQMLSDLGMAGVPWLGKTKKVMSFENFLKTLKMWRLDRWLESHKENKDELFKYFDEDGNGVLDAVEIGKLNAALYHMFPRFGYKGTEPPEDDSPHCFPLEILELSNLEYLNLYFQGFVHIPPLIGNLQDLKIINFSHNPNLLTIPAEIGLMTSLTRMDLDECPLMKTPPKEIRAKGFSTTFAYLRRLMSGSVACKRTKLMLVGLGGAGKTSLVDALLSKDGKATLEHGAAITDGIDICNWTVKAGDEHITYSVWDFAGQTVYYNTHQFFLSNRAVYLLLWNVRLGYEHAGLDFWLSSISVQAPKAPIFVIGSHIDQVSKYEVPINEMMSRYKQIAGFYFVSSFSGQGIKDLQTNLFEVTLQQQYMGEQIPEVWITFENNVISERTRSNAVVIEYTALERIANSSGIFDKTEVYQAVQFLHELGSLQHFTTENLKSKVIVNPQWIVDVMSCIVSVKNSPIKEGRLQHKDIATVWKDYPATLHDWLLKLTEEYDLTFPLDNQPVNLVPCLLPEKQPEFTWPEIDRNSDLKENKMVYKFDYLPAGLFNRSQVRLHQISDSALIWKKGSLLKKNEHIALLQQNRESELVVTVQGARPENVIFLVHEVFEGLIAESFRGVTYDFLIPCPDCLRMVLKDPHMFAASTIRRALELKAPFLQCVKYFHTISCVDLLACMPPDSHSDFDLHLVQSVRGLRDLRKDLAADLFISYCTKDASKDRKSVIHPATVNEDLVALGYKTWFPEMGQSNSIDEMARALTDASVFVVFMSADFVKDEECVNIFKYARLTLKKPMVVIATGDGFDWKQSKLGILLSDEVFVNMIKSKKEVYKSKFDELVSALGSRTHHKVGIDPTPSCFFSYTWVNSAQAVTLGTRKTPGAVGYGDPREIKAYLEGEGIKCWIDVERVGQNGLFDDIAEGLLSAKVVIVCVSDEYAASPTCQIEFRYAANTLKLPIVLAVVGTGNKWRSTEIGVLSLSKPIVSFQEKSETVHENLLKLVQENMTTGETDKERKNKLNEQHKNLSFQELFELAQRKLLRQLCFYAEHQDVDNYPRLFVLDFTKTKPVDIPADEPPSEGDDDKPAPAKRPLSRMMSIDEKGFSKKISDLKAAFKVQRFSVHTLCEHDEGWHSCTDALPLSHDFGESLLDKFSPCIARVTAVMKYNKQFKFNCMESDIGEDYVKWLDENPHATMSDYQQIYHEFRSLVIELDPHRTMGKLARCRLPNGKTIWLCEKHRSSMKVTVLSVEDSSSSKTETSGEEDLNMINVLRLPTYVKFADKFTSSTIAKRTPDNVEAVNKKKADMYTAFDLLPENKGPVPKPVIIAHTTDNTDKDSLERIVESDISNVEGNMEEEEEEILETKKAKKKGKKEKEKRRKKKEKNAEEAEDLNALLREVNENMNLNAEMEQEQEVDESVADDMFNVEAEVMPMVEADFMPMVEAEVMPNVEAEVMPMVEADVKSRGQKQKVLQQASSNDNSTHRNTNNDNKPAIKMSAEPPMSRSQQQAQKSVKPKSKLCSIM